MFGTDYIPGRSWGFILGMSVIPCTIDELVKIVYRRTGFGAREKASFKAVEPPAELVELLARKSESPCASSTPACLVCCALLFDSFDSFVLAFPVHSGRAQVNVQAEERKACVCVCSCARLRVALGLLMCIREREGCRPGHVSKPTVNSSDSGKAFCPR